MLALGMATPELETGRARALLRNRILILAGAVSLGLILQHLLALRLDQIVQLSKTDVLEARAQLAVLIRGVASVVFGMTGGLGVLIASSCRAWPTLDRYPPPGILAVGARRIVTGPRAKTLARVSLHLGVALLALSLAGFAIAWYVGGVLLACRAGVAA